MARSSVQRFAALAIVFVASVSIASADVVDFHYYPTAAQPCLYQASNSSNCDISTVAKYNDCVCSNGGGFLDSAASCLGANDSDDLTSVYNTLSTNCAGSNTPLSYTSQQWQKHGNSAQSSSSSSSHKTRTAVAASSTSPASASTTSASSATTTAVSSSASTSAAVNSTTSSKLGTGAIVGIAIGSAAVAAVVAGGLIFVLLRRRNKPVSGDSAYTPVPAYGGASGGVGHNIKDSNTAYNANTAHNANGAAASQGYTDPGKPSYAKQETGHPAYGQQNYQDIPLQTRDAQGNYTSPHDGAMELPAQNIEARHELPATHD